MYEPLIDDEVYGYQRVNVAAQQADVDSLFNWLKHALQIRRQHPAFSQGDLQLLPSANPALLMYWRLHAAERVLVINNLSGRDQPIELPANLAFIDLLSNTRLTQATVLAPHQFQWLQPVEV